MTFEPIAIVGQSCVLPGALSPGELWEKIRDGEDLITSTPAGYWRVDPESVMTRDVKDAEDRTWTDRGGYVHGFDSVFDAEGFALSAETIGELDPLYQWVMHCGREALRDARVPFDGPRVNAGRIGAIVGNLSYPSTALSSYAEALWLDSQGEDFIGGRSRQVAGVPLPTPINRFNSGMPAHFLAQALGLNAGAFCLDAACASSLYAIKIACDRLQDRRADVMLAGGVNRADDLFIHVGFCALQAMSRIGQSRPFHRDGDGLVPAEGAAMVVLKRLDDAVAAGDTIHGVIRVVGLSNDGRGRGMLVPYQHGQVRALRQAYELAGLTPADISLVECHATGTPVGDIVEIETMLEVFAGVKELPIGTIKSNLGHLITASGVAGLQKIIGAMRDGIRPKTLHAEDPLDAIGNNGTLRVLQESEPWEVDGPRRAAISNFGFGGNNAHLIVEEYRSETPVQKSAAPKRAARERVAIVAIEALVGDGKGIGDFQNDLFNGRSRVREQEDGQVGARAEGVELPLLGLRFPPSDLAAALGQQTFILKTMWQGMDRIGELPAERTGVLIGMQTDAEVGAYGARCRMENGSQKWARAMGLDAPPPGWADEARDSVSWQRGAAGAIGAMPNIPANRLNSQFDLAGFGFTVSSEELSGVVCLELAVRALQAGEMDAMVVGAVDLSYEMVQRTAAAAVLPEDRHIPGDAALILVLKRETDARQSGDTIYATLDAPTLDATPTPGAHLELGLGESVRSLNSLFGHSHTASGLVHVAAAALACRHRASPRGRGFRATPWLPESEPKAAVDRVAATVTIEALGGQSRRVDLYADARAESLVVGLAPSLFIYSGADAAEVAGHVETDQRGDGGPARLVIATTAETLATKREQARALLADADGSICDRDQGIYFQPQSITGEVALVFTGPAGSYHGMGRELVLAFPELLQNVYEPCMEEAARWIYEPADGEMPAPESKLWGSSFVLIYQYIQFSSKQVHRRF